MKRQNSFGADQGGAAAVEMALVTPILLLLLFGSVELGNYFFNEHELVKSVRDGARFAARQPFSSFQTCDAPLTGPVYDDIKLVTRSGQLSGGTDRLPNWGNANATFDVTTRCSTGSATVNYSGIYSGFTSGGARFVEVTASLPYRPVLNLFGFPGSGLRLQAKQQAAVGGI